MFKLISVESEYFSEAKSVVFGDKQTTYCFFELCLIVLENIEHNGSAEFGQFLDITNNYAGFVDEYFRGELADD